MYLLDTMVVSELRRPGRDPNVARWAEHARAEDLYLSVVTIGEIERGLARQWNRDRPFAEQLVDWLDGLLAVYGNRVLPVDVPVARRWGRLMQAIEHGGNGLMIAATAKEHGLAVVTRNVRHFTRAGVEVIDPFES